MGKTERRKTADEIETDFTQELGRIKSRREESARQAKLKMSRAVNKIERWYSGQLKDIVSRETKDRSAVSSRLSIEAQEILRRHEKEISAHNRKRDREIQKVKEVYEAERDSLSKRKQEKLTPVEGDLVADLEKASTREEAEIGRAEEMRTKLLQGVEAEGTEGE